MHIGKATQGEESTAPSFDHSTVTLYDTSLQNCVIL